MKCRQGGALTPSIFQELKTYRLMLFRDSRGVKSRVIWPFGSDCWVEGGKIRDDWWDGWSTSFWHLVWNSTWYWKQNYSKNMSTSSLYQIKWLTGTGPYLQNSAPVLHNFYRCNVILRFKWVEVSSPLLKAHTQVSYEPSTIFRPMTPFLSFFRHGLVGSKNAKKLVPLTRYVIRPYNHA